MDLIFKNVILPLILLISIFISKSDCSRQCW